MRALSDDPGLNMPSRGTCLTRAPAKRSEEGTSTSIDQCPGDGEKGLRLYDWACLTMNPRTSSPWHRWVLFRRRISDGQIDYYVAAGPKETPVEELVRVAGMRWAIESCFELAKGEVGLDQYEVRSWAGWHRHITLSMAALAFLAVIRMHELPQKGASPIEGRRGNRMGAFKQYRKAAELERTGTQQG